MELKHVKDLQLSWLLPYGGNGSDGLSGINIIVQNTIINDPTGNHQKNSNNILLLASLLTIKNEEFNLVSLSSEKNHAVSAEINIAKDKAADFKKTLKYNFNKLKVNFHSDTKLKLVSTIPRNYHIIGGLFIFELINRLNEKINRLRNITNTKLTSAIELIKISSGEPFNGLSDLEIDLQYWSQDQSIIQKIWSKIHAFGRAYKLSVV